MVQSDSVGSVDKHIVSTVSSLACCHAHCTALRRAHCASVLVEPQHPWRSSQEFSQLETQLWCVNFGYLSVCSSSFASLRASMT